MAMQKELKIKWTTALRSGKYKQANHYLETRNHDSGKITGNCCLGVLCRVAGIKATKEYGCSSFHGTAGDLDILQRRFGLTSRQEDTLIRMNDEENKSFDEIANWIRLNVRTSKRMPKNEKRA